MHLHRLSWPMFLLPVALAGCSTTAGSRFGGTPPQAKTIAIVGDQPMPAKSGEPGGQVAADVPEPEPRRNPKTRISGRVVDDQGDPVPNVTVRLADGGTKGGKDIRARTDRSGAFTLNGLRPGSTYSLIAEAEDDQGPLVGRAQARTADTGVEISLTGEEAPKKSGRPSRIRPISNREETGTTRDDDEPRVNREDLGPPADEADTLDPGPPTSKPRRPQLSAPDSTSVGWKNGASNANRAGAPSQDEEIVASASESPARKRRPVPAVDPEDEDGPNPLPPALEPGGDEPARAPARKKTRPRTPKPAPKDPEPGEIDMAPEARREPDKAEPEATIVAALPPVAPLVPDPEPSPASLPPAVAAAPKIPTPAPEPASAFPAMPAIVPAPVAVAEAPPPMASPPEPAQAPRIEVPTIPAARPVFASQPPPAPNPSADYNPFLIAAPAPPAAPSASVVAPQVVAAPMPPKAPASGPLLPDEFVQTVADAPKAEPPAPAAEGPQEKPLLEPAPRKAKWGELAASDKPPLAANDRPAAAVATTRPVSLVKRVLGGSAEKQDPSVAACTYDPRLQKLTDFRLPDLAGKPVRFQDFDSDYVLIDFWGTWCPPCLESIPHLVALQKKYGPSKLRVVGIACEEVAPEKRRAKVEEVARNLGINYPVLLSGMDGKPCPVQQKFQVQSYPTMILVDLKGQVVWRNTGSTPASEDRLDRVLASKLGRTSLIRR